MYKCERCGYSTEYKGNLKNHLNRKKPCKPILSLINIETLKYKINNNLLNSKKLINLIKNEPKMNPIEPKIEKNEPKMNPIEPFIKLIEPKLNPIEPKLNPINKLNPIEPKMNPIKPKLNPIKPKLNPINKSSKTYICKFCKKTYSTNSHMHRHMKRCSSKKQLEESSFIKYISNQIKELKEEHTRREEIHIKEKAEMRKEIENLLDKVGNVTNNITNQQNVFINSHGHENLDYITQTYLNNLLKIPYGAVPKLLKDIHFHPEHPENSNIVITNKKLNYAKVWEDNKWNIKDKQEVIKNMLDKGFNLIDEQFVVSCENLEKSKKKNYTEFQKRFENSDKKLHKELIKDTEIIIINNS